MDDFSRVTFDRMTPRKVWLGGKERLSFGEPTWTHLDRHAVEQLIGQSIADELPT